MSETTDKLQEWASGLTGQAREAANTVIDWAERTNAKIDFNKDGKPDLNQLAQGASEGVQNAAHYLSEQGVALYERLPESVQSAGEQAAEFASNNRVGIGGFLLAAILGMALFEMGPIGALLLGALAFAAGNLLGDGKNGLLGGLLGQGKEGPSQEQERGHGHSQERGGAEQGHGQEQGQAPAAGEQISSVVQVMRDGKPIGTNAQGQQEFGSRASEVTFLQPGADGQPAYQITGAVDGIGRQDEFRITKISAVLPDGTVVPAVEGYSFENVTIDGQGRIDLASPSLDGARQRADRAAQQFTAPTELAVSRDPADPTRVAVSLGTTQIEGKDYTVEMRGSAVGPQAQFTHAVLMDGNVPVTDSKGEVIELGFSEPQTLAIENNNVHPMSGRVTQMRDNISATVIGEQRRELAAANQAREAEIAQFTGDIEAQPTQQAAGALVRENYQDRLANHGVDRNGAILASSAIAEEYARPEFRSLSPEEAASQVATLPDVQRLGEQQTSRIQDDVRLLHERTAQIMESKTPAAPESIDMANNLNAPAVPAQTRGTETGRT